MHAGQDFEIRAEVAAHIDHVPVDDMIRTDLGDGEPLWKEEHG